MSYRYLNNIALADAAYEAVGDTVPEMFKAAGDALLSIMVSDVESVRPQTERSFELSSDKQETDALEDLLYQFLEKLLYYKDADGLLLRPEDVQFDSSWKSLSAIVRGQKIEDFKNEQEGALGADAKAITHHRFEVSKADGGWKALVVVDV